ncbi:MAG: Na+/H+ antiporter subunit E [Actinomycetota bacterium]
MSNLLRPRRVALVIILTAAWCTLWGEVSWANVLAGLAVGIAIVASGMCPPGLGSLRLGPLVRFAALVTRDLVQSTIQVAREILTPTDHTDESIIRVDVPADTRRHLLLLVVAITVTPGTAVVDADPDTGALYLHVLHHDRHEQVRAHVQRLAELGCAALPGPSRTEALR